MAIRSESVNGGKKIVLRHVSGTKKGELAGSISTEGRDGIATVDAPNTPNPFLSEDETGADLLDAYERFQETLDAAQIEPKPEVGPLANLTPAERVGYDLSRILPAGLSEDQMADIFKKQVAAVRRYQDTEEPTEEEWRDWLVAAAEKVADPDSELTDREREEMLLRLAQASTEGVPDKNTWALLTSIEKRTWKAHYALGDASRQIASWVDADEHEVRANVAAFRDEYYAMVDAGEEPYIDPQYAKAWGTTSDNAPKDRATVYSHYKAENPELYTNPVPPKRYVALDLETTGLSTRDHHIIEVGLVEYDQNGKETGRWSQLVRPPLDANGQLTTGDPEVVAVHGINVADVADAPSFSEILPSLRERLEGATIIGHNLGFDTKFIKVNLRRHAPEETPEMGYPTWTGEADTVFHARRFMTGLENNKLVTVSASLGIPYTNGHRAEHDAAVAGEVFFEIRKELKARQAAAIKASNGEAA